MTSPTPEELIAHELGLRCPQHKLELAASGFDDDLVEWMNVVMTHRELAEVVRSLASKLADVLVPLEGEG